MATTTTLERLDETEVIATEKDTARDFLKRPMFAGEELMKIKFPPVEDVVPHLMPIGTNMLVASPKIGKSWLALQLAFAVATGTDFLGCIRVPQRPVMYFSLEDGTRRLQNRLKHMGVTADTPMRDLNFTVMTDNPFEDMRDFLDVTRRRHPLIIVDTLGRIKPFVKIDATRSGYDNDVSTMSYFNRIVDEYDGASFLLIHHTRKMAGVDFLDEVSGSNGIAGSADAVLKLDRPRKSHEGTLSLTGRDVIEADYKVVFDGDTGLWRLAGGSLAAAAEAAREDSEAGSTGDLRKSIVAFVEEMGAPVNVKNVASHFGIPYSTAANTLKRAATAGEIVQSSRGCYARCA